MAKPKTVYVVFQDPRYEPFVVGVFSTEAKAAEAVGKAKKLNPLEEYSWDEWTVDGNPKLE